MEDTQTQAVETAGEGTPAVASPATDQQPAATEQASTQAPAKTEEATPEQRESSRLGRRLAQVAEKARQDERERITAAQPQTQEDEDWTQYQQPNAEVQRLAQKVAQLEQNLTAKQQEDLAERVQRTFADEARRVEERYPKYNPDSPEFDKAASDAVLKMYGDNAALLIHNPRAQVQTLSEFVDEFERQVARAAENAKSQASATSASQASEAAIAPTAYKEVSKSFEQMTKAEKEAYLGVV